MTEIISTVNKISEKESILLKVRVILKKVVTYLSTNFHNISNIFFEWFLSELEAENMVAYEVLEQVSEENIIAIAPIASLFILRIIRSMSKVNLHDITMNSLSNLIVGVYANITKVNFNKKLQKVSD